MIHFFDDAPDVQLQSLVQPHIEQFDKDVRKFLPELPDTVNIWLDNSVLIDATGEGGFAYSPDTITVAFDPDFADKQSQLQQLRGTIFHESYHLVQGHTAENPRAIYTSALDNAIYEGCATVFERTYAGSNPLWGDYSQHDITMLTKWKLQLSAISPADYNSPHTNLWQTWAHYDQSDQQRWKTYKVGAWIVDNAIKSSSKTILDLRNLSAATIQELT